MDPQKREIRNSPIEDLAAPPLAVGNEIPPSGEVGGGVQPNKLSGVWSQTLQSRTAVLATLFLVTGALGLPMLWYSPVFSRVDKILWTLMIMIYTTALIGVTWAIVVWCYRLVMSSLF